MALRGAPSRPGFAGWSFNRRSGATIPRTRRFEVFAEGGGNTWGLDFDATGNAFGSSNGAYVTFHMIQGGYYLKGFAKHGPLHNPHAFGYFGPIAYHGTKQGGHVTPGGIIYKGDAAAGAIPRCVHRGQSAVECGVLARARTERLDVRGRHGGTLIDAPRSLVSADRSARRAGCGGLRGGLVRSASLASRSPRHVGPDQRADLSRCLWRAPAVRRLTWRRHRATSWSRFRDSSNDWFAAEARRILGERRDPEVVPALKELLTGRSRGDGRAARSVGTLCEWRVRRRDRARSAVEHRSPACGAGRFVCWATIGG